MSKHPEPIHVLIERSSLGSKEARAARSTVSRAVAYRLAVAANASRFTGTAATTAQRRRTRS